MIENDFFFFFNEENEFNTKLLVLKWQKNNIWMLGVLKNNIYFISFQPKGRKNNIRTLEHKAKNLIALTLEGGFEPPTLWLTATRSNQLSYSSHIFSCLNFLNLKNNASFNYFGQLWHYIYPNVFVNRNYSCRVDVYGVYIFF